MQKNADSASAYEMPLFVVFSHVLLNLKVTISKESPITRGIFVGRPHTVEAKNGSFFQHRGV